jgi:serine/threonine-protein kinase
MAADLRPGSRFGAYDINGLIGRGGMGVVHVATHPVHGRIALKLIRPEFASDKLFRARFEREARLAAEIDHPNLIPVYEAGEWEARLFLAMRYVDGIDLGSMVALDGRLHPRDAAPLVVQVASVLDAAHAYGLVHRDVKPENVLIEVGLAAPHAYLTDFGLSRMASSQSGLTRTGLWVGTTAYAAPALAPTSTDLAASSTSCSPAMFRSQGLARFRR